MESYDTASWWARARHDDRVKAERRQACIRGESAFDPATVKFAAEPEPEPAREGRRPVVYFGKGTCYAQAPIGAIARRGGGEDSFVAFYDSAGGLIAAYRSRSSGASTWAVPMAEDEMRRYIDRTGCHFPTLAIGPTPLEAAINRVFGVAGR